MKKFLSVLLIAASANAFSTEVFKIVVCDNHDENHPEDSLILDYFSNTATYNDNDTKDIKLACSMNSAEIYTCANKWWTIKVLPSGETQVFEGPRSLNPIIFDCKTDEEKK